MFINFIVNAVCSGCSIMNIHIKHVTLCYDKHTAVDQVTLQIPERQVTVLVGPNGCGKSTLLKSIAGVHLPTLGEIFIDHKNVYEMKPRERATCISLLPQSPHAPEGITVEGLIRFGRHPHQGFLQRWSQADEEAVQNALAASGMNEFASRSLDTLSGGQRQRCWLAMSLAQETPILLLDEPTSMLDIGHQKEVLDLTKSLSAQGKTIVLVLHDINAAVRTADHLIAMRDGQCIAQGLPQDIVNQDLIFDLYNVHAQVLQDPQNQAPIIVC